MKKIEWKPAWQKKKSDAPVEKKEVPKEPEQIIHVEAEDVPKATEEDLQRLRDVMDKPVDTSDIQVMNTKVCPEEICQHPIREHGKNGCTHMNASEYPRIKIECKCTAAHN